MNDEAEAPRQQAERFRQFLRALDGLSKSVGKLSEAVAKNTEMTALLFDAITKEKEGLIPAIDDLIEAKEGLAGQIDSLRRDFPRLVTALVRRGGGS